MMNRVVIVLGALCATASAQPGAPTPAPAPAPPAVDPAEQALQEGRRLYDLREFAKAIERFKEAYRLRNDAASLFNIAQSYRLMNDCPQAYTYYKTFQRNFPSERPDVVAKFIAELEPCKDAKPSEPTQPINKPSDPVKPVEPVKPKDPPPIVVDEPTAPGRTLRISGLAVGGVGVAALATGVVFGLRARSQSRELNNSDVWDPSLDASAKRSDRNAKILLGVGGAAIVGGAVLYYLGYRAESSSQVAIIPSTDGAAVAWSFRFE
jgi:tetratricopeptide (TPR) repeat protein